jgi:hypothetical protein
VYTPRFNSCVYTTAPSPWSENFGKKQQRGRKEGSKYFSTTQNHTKNLIIIFCEVKSSAHPIQLSPLPLQSTPSLTTIITVRFYQVALFYPLFWLFSSIFNISIKKRRRVYTQGRLCGRRVYTYGLNAGVYMRARNLLEKLIFERCVYT